MTIDKAVEQYLLKSPYYLPYVYSLVVCGLGFSIFQYTHELKDLAGIIVTWIGVVLMLFSLVSLALWHFLKWPPYFGGSRNEIRALKSGSPS